MDSRMLTETFPLSDSPLTEAPLAEGWLVEGALVDGALTDGPLTEDALTEGPLAECALTEDPLAEAALTKGAPIGDPLKEGALAPKVYVIGVGMGNPDTLTLRARGALGESALVIGSPRLLAALDALGLGVPTLPLVRATEIADALRDASAPVASVVMSGDVGLYSGATKLVPLLEDKGFEVECVPGISSLSYLCARLRVPWQDVRVASAHGRACDVAGLVQSESWTFALTGGDATPASLCAELAGRGLADVRVWVGERLSYPDERISCGTAGGLASGSFDPLSAMLVENVHPISSGPSAPCLPDGAFERGGVPMTKEEVRELAICKLRIAPDSVVWDVGAGTGSVTAEAARVAYRGQVIAVERDGEAQELIRCNAYALGLTNVRVIEGCAPEALAGLPAPDCAFVGGSGGRLEDILRAVLAANARARLCVAAITVETLAEALRCARELGLAELDLLQLSVARAQELGSYHLMRAENPVWLITATGGDAGMATGGRGA